MAGPKLESAGIVRLQPVVFVVVDRAVLSGYDWSMDHEPQFSKTARTHVPVAPYKWVAPIVSAPVTLAAIGGLSWADAPGIALKALIVVLITSTLVAALYFLFKHVGAKQAR